MELCYFQIFPPPQKKTFCSILQISFLFNFLLLFTRQKNFELWNKQNLKWIDDHLYSALRLMKALFSFIYSIQFCILNIRDWIP